MAPGVPGAACCSALAMASVHSAFGVIFSLWALCSGSLRDERWLKNMLVPLVPEPSGSLLGMRQQIWAQHPHLVSPLEARSTGV